MKLYIFPPSPRALGIVALNNQFALNCEIRPIDLGRGGQLTPEEFALNPNKKMASLEDDGFVLWESNAILFYMATNGPDRSHWPSDLKGHADVLRCLPWRSAHWDAEPLGMVAYEKASKAVPGIGPPDPAFIARGEQNFSRFAAVLNEALRGKTSLTGERLTICDFCIGTLVPTAERVRFPVRELPEILRWYKGLAALSSWQQAVATKTAATAVWQSQRRRIDDAPK